MRTKKSWNQKSRERSIEQIANAICATIWKIAQNVVLTLENDDFETSTHSQRMDVMEEVACYLIHFSDRWIYDRGSSQQRAVFVSTLAKDIGRLLQENRQDIEGEGRYARAFFEKLNLRSSDYATYSYDAVEGCSFPMRCQLGNYIQAVMGERDSKWIPDFIVGRDAPEIEASLRRSLNGLVKLESVAEESRPGEAR